MRRLTDHELIGALRICTGEGDVSPSECRKCPAHSWKQGGCSQINIENTAADRIVEYMEKVKALEAMETVDTEIVVRCKDCIHKNTEFCRAVWKTKYDLKKEKWKCKTMMEDDGFCSIGAAKVNREPKEEAHD